MLTNATFVSLLLFWLASRARGATVTWGQVNKYASTLHAQDVYLPRDNSTDADADAEVVADVVYGLQNVDGYTITAVHAYDMTPLEEHGGDGGTAQLLGWVKSMPRCASSGTRQSISCPLCTSNWSFMASICDLAV